MIRRAAFILALLIAAPGADANTSLVGPRRALFKPIHHSAAPVTPCSGSLTLDYSNNCNFMAMAWGE